MSKASEWVHARGRADALRVKPLDWPAFVSMAPRKEVRLTTEVVTLDIEPALKITDVRMDSIVLDANAALAIAHWIIDTFGARP